MYDQLLQYFDVYSENASSEVLSGKPRSRNNTHDENTAPLRTSRHGSTTSEGDDYHNQSATERRNNWEKKAGRGFSFEKGRVKAHGGATGSNFEILELILYLSFAI